MIFPKNWRLLAILMIVLQSVLYAILDPFSKLAYGKMPIYSFLTVRYLFATGVMLLIWGKQILQELRTTSVKFYALPCVCMSAAFIVSNTALKYTTVANVAFVRSLTAVIATLLLVLFFHKRFGARTLLVLMLMVGGLYLLCSQHGMAEFGRGEIYSLVSATMVATALVFGATALRHMQAITLSCAQSFGSIWLCLFAGALDGSLAETQWTLLCQGDIALTLVYAAVGCTVAGYLLQNIALQHISSNLVGILQSLYPVLTAIVAYIVLGERMTPLGMLGALIILGSVLLASAERE